MQLTLTFLWALGAAAILAAPKDGARAPVVMTRTGGVRGAAKTSSQGVPYFRYLGIPYAKPPTGARRFSRPEPAEAWTGTRNARHFGASCPQPSGPFKLPTLLDEDCLFLNVFAPQSANSSSPLPVMVFVHGGGFYLGSSSFDAEALCGKDVVVVTINYRLGALGFLSTGDAVAPGNYGLLDQLLALQWVRDNIAAFHGDPHKVTIFGESAGAVSVSLLLLSPLSKGLFQGVIAESGSSLAPFAVAQSYNYPSQPAIAKDLASKVGCQPTDDHAALVACLRTKDAQTLATADVVKDVNEGLSWRPVVEREYGVLPQPPLTLLQQGRFLHVPVMSGTNQDEGTLFALLEVPNIQDGLPRYFFEAMVREFMFSRFGDRAFGLAPRALEVYTKGLNKSDPRDLRAAWVQLQTDWTFFVPSLGELLLLQSQDPQTPCFQYLFSRRPDATELPAWMGVPHAFEVSYVFGAPFLGEGDFFNLTSNFTDVDRQVSDDMMTMWTNFAKYGNPTPKPVDGEPWPVFTAHSRAYLRIGSPLLLDTDLKHDVFQFWGQEVFNAVLGPSTPAPAQASRPTPPVLPVVG